MIVYRCDNEGDMIAGLGDGSQGEVATLHHQYLAGERETDARAMAFGGVEWDEEVAMVLRGD